jgi:3-hydroxyisobutyrate dehydrogenase-like beta-hydroxyacid dehydrogenase
MIIWKSNIYALVEFQLHLDEKEIKMEKIKDKKPVIGIIGIGLMGHGIATNVQKSGWKLNFLIHDGNQNTDNLTAAGAKAYTSGEALAANSEIIIICVTGTPQVENVLYHEQGVLAGIKKNTVIIDCSTSLPASTIEIAKRVEATGGLFLDAPMTRTPKEAAEGRLNLLVGGDKELAKQHLPLMQSYAEKIVYCGPVGSGHTLKLLHNYVSLGFSTVLAEAAASSADAGIDPEVLINVLSSGGGKGAILDRLTPYITSGDNSNFRFSIANAHKDISYYLSMVNESTSGNHAAKGINHVLNEAVLTNHAESTLPELISILQKNKGLS